MGDDGSFSSGFNKGYSRPDLPPTTAAEAAGVAEAETHAGMRHGGSVPLSRNELVFTLLVLAVPFGILTLLLTATGDGGSAGGRLLNSSELALVAMGLSLALGAIGSGWVSVIVSGLAQGPTAHRSKRSWIALAAFNLLLVAGLFGTVMAITGERALGDPAAGIGNFAGQIFAALGHLATGLYGTSSSGSEHMTILLGSAVEVPGWTALALLAVPFVAGLVAQALTRSFLRALLASALNGALVWGLVALALPLALPYA